LFVVGLVVFAGIVFVVDLFTPSGVEVWVLYLPVILAPIALDSARYVILSSAACSLLVVLGSAISPAGGNPVWLDYLNRGMGLAAMWLMAFAGVLICFHSSRLQGALARLQQEVDEHRRTEETLRQSEERLRLVAQGTGMGTWDLNLATGKAIWSESHFKLLGYYPIPGGVANDEMFRERLHAEDEPRVLEARDQARREHGLYSAEHRICRADDRQVAWLASYGRFLYDASGQATRFLGVSFDITRRKELEREVVEIAAQEQSRIGQELHDGVGQELTGLGLMAGALVSRLDGHDAEEQIADRLRAGLERLHQEVRTLSRRLVPVQLEANGLSDALHDLAASSQEQSGVAVRFECPQWHAAVDHATATQLFRIAQEAVSNALRHGRPQHVSIALSFAPKQLHLRIEDDGAGIPPDRQESHGMGLRIMQYRAGLIGASLDVARRPEGGTAVVCTLPGRSDGRQIA
jgi:PAS domain S-box-containing protein